MVSHTKITVSIRAATLGLAAACVLATVAEPVAAVTDPCRVQQAAFNKYERKAEKASNKLEAHLTKVGNTLQSLEDRRQNALTQAQTYNALRNDCDGDGFWGGVYNLIVGGRSFKTTASCQRAYEKLRIRWQKKADGYVRKIQTYTASAEKKTERLRAASNTASEKLADARAALNQCRASSPSPTPTPGT